MSAPDEGQPLTLGDLFDVVRFCVRAVLRYRKMAVVIVAVILGAALLLALSTPHKWAVDVRILTKRSYIIQSLVNPRRAVPLDSDRPTRGAVEIISSYGFREELLDATNLPELARKHQGRFERFQVKVDTILDGEADPRVLRGALIKLLGRNIEATLVEDGVLNIQVSWSHPEVALVLAEELVDLFLRNQKAAELDEIHDTVDIIRRNVVRAHSRLTETTTRLSELIRQKEAEVTRRLTVRESRERRTVSFRRPAAAPPPIEARDGQQPVAQQIRDKERELRRLVDQHEQRVVRAEQDLKRLEESLGPRHPDLRAAKRELEQARPVPVAITNLRTEISRLRSQQPVSRPGDEGEEEESARFEVVLMPLSEDVYNALQADPEVVHMMEEVRKYATEYGEQLDRLEAAQLEIEMTNAAFAYRYMVTQPPVFPSTPISSKRKMIMAAGLLFALFLALVACVARDLATGRIRARWQVERLLGVRVLGQARLDD